MNSNVFGIDIAKQVFQIHWVDQETGEIHSDKVKRKDFVKYFANQQPSIIVLARRHVVALITGEDNSKKWDIL